jgi:hypothetical protein
MTRQKCHVRVSFKLIMVVLNLALLPACKNSPNINLSDLKPSDTQSTLQVSTVTSGTMKFAVAGATVQALGRVCTTGSGGACTFLEMPLQTIAVTVTHPNYADVSRDVVMQKAIANSITFELQAK